MNSAILVASFGSTHLDTLENCVYPMEKALQAQFPNTRFYRSFLSNIVRRRLAEKQGMEIPDTAESMEQMLQEGVTELVVQPTLIIPGEEFDRLKAQLQPYADRVKISLGQPLLSDPEVTESLLDLLDSLYGSEDGVLLLMGHGTDHPAGKIYEDLAEQLRRRPGHPMRMCTVEGTPNFEDAVQEIQAQGFKKATLVPLMLVAGDHAKNDMAGPEKGSLASMLQAVGVETHCVIDGLGSKPQVQQMFCRLAAAAKPLSQA